MNRAVSLDGMPALCGNNPETQSDTDILQRAQAQCVPTRRFLSAPYRWRWKPAWSPEDVNRALKGDKYAMRSLPYLFYHDDGELYTHHVYSWHVADHSYDWEGRCDRGVGGDLDGEEGSRGWPSYDDYAAE